LRLRQHPQNQWDQWDQEDKLLWRQ